MTDLVVFAGAVGLAGVVGLLVGIIVAGRIDRVLVRRPAGAPDDSRRLEEDHE